MRRFGGERVTYMLNRFTSEDEQGEIASRCACSPSRSRRAEGVEAMNFERAQNVLRFDDV
jgi:preprotein translocase subunit SecA